MFALHKLLCLLPFAYTFYVISVFVLCFYLLFSASKTVLNSMLKEPSLIPDQTLANNVYQVSVLTVTVYIF